MQLTVTKVIKQIVSYRQKIRKEMHLKISSAQCLTFLNNEQNPAVTDLADPKFGMPLGCHGSCFTNYPEGRASPLCPYFLPAVCIVCGIIFPQL